PAVAALRRVLGVEGQVHRAAEIDPADERAPVLVAQRSYLAGLDRLRRRHDAAAEIALRQDALVNRLLPGRRLGRQAGEALAVDLPDQQAPPRLEAADVAGNAQVVAGQLVVGRGHRPRVAQVPARPRNRPVVVQGQLAGGLGQLVAVAGDAAPLENRADV